MKMTKIENVIISDWVDDPIHIYNEARLVIVPSQWEEAFGRVAREATIWECLCFVRRSVD